MEELLKNEAVRTKIKMLSPPVRKSFIENLLDLYEQEAEEMIDLIEESRMELRGDYLSFSDETKSLRAESRQLEERRKESDKDKVYKKKGRNSRMADSRLSYVDEEINNKSIQHYLNKRGKRRPPAVDVNRSQSEDVTLETRPFSVFSMRSTRSLPTPVSNRTVEEEKDAVMKNLSSAHEQSEAERQRQIERVAQRREMRRQQKQTTEEKALELLEKAVEMDRRLAEKKKVQDQKLRDRLEDIKKKKEKERHELASESPAMRPTSSHRPLSAMRPPASGSTAKGDNIKPHHSDSNDISDSSRGRERSAISDEKHGSRSDKHGSRSARKDEKGSSEKLSDYDFTIY